MAVLEFFYHLSTVGFPSAPNDLYHPGERACQ